MSGALAPLGVVLSVLDGVGIGSMLVGSVASTHFGPVRATQDVDLVIDADPDAIERLLARIDRERFYVPEETARIAATTNGQFNIIDLASPWKFDLMLLAAHPWDRVRFERRVPASIGGVQAQVSTPEDIVLAKLLWARLGGSERQVEDASGVLEVMSGSLDEAYLDQWAAELGIADSLAEIRRRLA